VTTAIAAETVRMNRPRLGRPGQPLTPKLVLIRIGFVAVILAALFFWVSKNGALPVADAEAHVEIAPAIAAPGVAHGAKGIVGANFGNSLFADYTGISGVVPASATVNFCRQLDSLWERKQR